MYCELMRLNCLKPLINSLSYSRPSLCIMSLSLKKSVKALNLWSKVSCMAILVNCLRDEKNLKKRVYSWREKDGYMMTPALLVQSEFDMPYSFLLSLNDLKSTYQTHYNIIYLTRVLHFLFILAVALYLTFNKSTYDTKKKRKKKMINFLSQQWLQRRQRKQLSTPLVRAWNLLKIG